MRNKGKGAISAKGGDGGLATQLVPRVLAALEARDIESAEEVLADHQAAGGDPRLGVYLRALVLIRMGELYSALQATIRLEQAAPEMAEAHGLLALLHARLGQQGESLYHAKVETALPKAFPDLSLPPAWLGSVADAFFTISDRVLLHEAKAAFRAGDVTLARRRLVESVSLDSGDPEAWSALARYCLVDGQPVAATRAAEVAVGLTGGTGEAHALMAECLAACGRLEEARGQAKLALEQAPGEPGPIGLFLHLHAFQEDGSPEGAMAFAGTWRGLFPSPEGIPPRPLSPGARGKVGIVSGRLNRFSPHAGFLSTVEQALYRCADLVYYSLSGEEDNASRRLRRTASRWLDLSGVDDETAAHIISNEDLDCLIDLDGFSPGGRPGMVARIDIPRIWAPFATRGAGVHAGTQALSDPACPSRARLHMASGLSLWPPYRGMQVGAKTRSWDGRLPRVIAVEGDLARQGPASLALLSQVLRAAPDARLLVTRARLSEEEAVQLFQDRLQAAGIDPAKARFAAPGAPDATVLGAADAAFFAWPASSPEFAVEAARWGLAMLAGRPAMAEHAMATSQLVGIGLERALLDPGPSFAEAALDWVARWRAEPGLQAEMASALDAAARGEGSFERGQVFQAWLSADASEGSR